MHNWYTNASIENKHNNYNLLNACNKIHWVASKLNPSHVHNKSHNCILQQKFSKTIITRHLAITSIANTDEYTHKAIIKHIAFLIPNNQHFNEKHESLLNPLTNENFLTHPNPQMTPPTKLGSYYTISHNKEQPLSNAWPMGSHYIGIFTNGIFFLSSNILHEFSTVMSMV
jgi:hypothetical protein